MTETFETSIPRFVDKLAKLSMEDVALSKNKDKFIQQEILEKVKIGNRLLENNIYTEDFFNKAIKDRRRELAEEANPLGARTGRQTMSDGKLVGNQKKLDVDGSGSIDEKDFAILRASKQDGGSIDDQMSMLMNKPEMESDEEMEENYIEFIMDEALSEDEQDFLMNELRNNDMLSEVFDKVIEVASEFAGSGPVEGPGSGVSDSIPARLSDGEFVFTAKSVKEIGADNLQRMMEDAEEAVDSRQQMANGGEMEEEDTVVMPVEQQPVRQDIRVTRETVGAQAGMQEQSDLTDDEIKKSMLSTRPYVRS
tara:strand:- start:4101 stop:5027 length:927 start_codon:yes stop_codon:yes gene_type:complete